MRVLLIKYRSGFQSLYIGKRKLEVDLEILDAEWTRSLYAVVESSDSGYVLLSFDCIYIPEVCGNFLRVREHEGNYDFEFLEKCHKFEMSEFEVDADKSADNLDNDEY